MVDFSVYFQGDCMTARAIKQVFIMLIFLISLKVDMSSRYYMLRFVPDSQHYFSPKSVELGFSTVRYEESDAFENAQKRGKIVNLFYLSH